jgi:hypothetical protein
LKETLTGLYNLAAKCNIFEVMKMRQLEVAGLKAVQLLRKNKLKQGHPFMINLESLPDGQCYLEYPDGAIRLVVLNTTNQNFEILKELSAAEQAGLKEMLQLY